MSQKVERNLKNFEQSRNFHEAPQLVHLMEFGIRVLAFSTGGVSRHCRPHNGLQFQIVFKNSITVHAPL